MSAAAGPPSGRTVAGAAVLYFGLVFGAGFVLGAVRVPFIVPRVGERLAELAEMPVMWAVIYFAARTVSRRLALPRQPAVRLQVGSLALLLMLCAELLLAVVLAGRSAAEYVASRDPVSGSVYLATLLLFAAMPWLQARGRGPAAPGSTHPA
jgi:hypothetical protein